MLDWFFDTPLWIRALIGLGLLAVSTLFWMGGRFWPWGWAVGVIILLASIPNRGGGERTRW